MFLRVCVRGCRNIWVADVQFQTLRHRLIQIKVASKFGDRFRIPVQSADLVSTETASVGECGGMLVLCGKGRARRPLTRAGFTDPTTETSH